MHFAKPHIFRCDFGNCCCTMFLNMRFRTRGDMARMNATCALIKVKHQESNDRRSTQVPG